MELKAYLFIHIRKNYSHALDHKSYFYRFLETLFWRTYESLPIGINCDFEPEQYLVYFTRIAADIPSCRSACEADESCSAWTLFDNECKLRLFATHQSQSTQK